MQQGVLGEGPAAPGSSPPAAPAKSDNTHAESSAQAAPEPVAHQHAQPPKSASAPSPGPGPVSTAKPIAAAKPGAAPDARSGSRRQHASEPSSSGKTTAQMQAELVAKTLAAQVAKKRTSGLLKGAPATKLPEPKEPVAQKNLASEGGQQAGAGRGVTPKMPSRCELLSPINFFLFWSPIA